MLILINGHVLLKFLKAEETLLSLFAVQPIKLGGITQTAVLKKEIRLGSSMEWKIIMGLAWCG